MTTTTTDTWTHSLIVQDRMGMVRCAGAAVVEDGRVVISTTLDCGEEFARMLARGFEWAVLIADDSATFEKWFAQALDATSITFEALSGHPATIVLASPGRRRGT